MGERDINSDSADLDTYLTPTSAPSSTPTSTTICQTFATGIAEAGSSVARAGIQRHTALIVHVLFERPSDGFSNVSAVSSSSERAGGDSILWPHRTSSKE